MTIQKENLDKKVDELRGQPFIAKTDGDGHPRSCKKCFWVELDRRRHPEDCELPAAQKYFKEKEVPNILDGKEVAQYCPLFQDYILV